MEEKILFGAEMEGGGFAAGADGIISKLTQMKGAQEELIKSSAGIKTAMTLNQIEINKTEKALQSINSATQNYDQEVGKLQLKLIGLKNEQASLGKGLVTAESQMKQMGVVTKIYGNALGELQEKHGVVSKQLEKMTSVNHLAAEGMGLFRRRIVDVGFAIAGGLVGSLTGLALPAIEQFIEKLVESQTELGELEKSQKIVNAVFDEAAKNVGKQAAQLEVFKAKLNDTSLSENERVKVAKEYNKVADEQNKIDLRQIDNLKLINEQIEKQNKLIIARAVAMAAMSKLGEEATKLVEAQLKLSEGLKEQGITEEQLVNVEDKAAQTRIEVYKKVTQSLDNFSGANNRFIENQKKNTKEGSTAIGKQVSDLLSLRAARDNAQEDLEKMAALLNPLISVEGITTKDKGTGKDIENVFRQKLLELRARLAAASTADFQSDSLIQAKFKAQLDKEFEGIAKLLKEKKLTGQQADILKGLIDQINGIELDKALGDFHKKQKDALQKINDSISAALVDDAAKHVANIRDEFEREGKLIEQQFDATTVALNKKFKELTKAIDEDVKKGLVSTEAGDQKKKILAVVFGDLLTQAGIDKTNKELELAFKKFQDTLNTIKRDFSTQELGLSEGTTTQIQEQTKFFLAGTITYDRYQKNLTKILKEEAAARRKIQLEELNTELAAINKRLEATTDPAQRKKLEEQQKSVRNSISVLSRQIATETAKDSEETTKKLFDNIIAYAHSVQDLVGQIGSFWEQALQTEANYIERSIALQQRRVDNAREIADKGNAEYLEMEQKRMDELQRKREENARKQLAVNNALALSNAIVAAITAIAQAVETGSPFAAIAAVAAVIGAIGAAYSFANSLQPVSADFYEGTEYVEGKGRPRGKDTVPANLTIGERVITANKNQEYWDTLTAIHNEKIPPAVLNEFVNAYPNVNTTIDFNRLSEATNNKFGFDSIEVARELEQTNQKLDVVVKAISSIGMSVKMDESGFSAALDTYKQKERNRKRS